MLLLSLGISIQPFANVVSGYTCCDRNQKRDDEFHADHLLHCEGVDSKNKYMMYFPLFQVFCIEINVLAAETKRDLLVEKYFRNRLSEPQEIVV